MKRLIALALLLVACCTVTVAHAKDWTCPDDGAINSGKYCYQCGKHKDIALATATPKPTPTKTPTPTATPKPVQRVIEFGHYPQTSTGKDNTPIEWLVLDVQNNKALLISRYGLDVQPFNTTCDDVTWWTCSLRKWLNNTFLKKAFSSKEQKAIL